MVKIHRLILLIPPKLLPWPVQIKLLLVGVAVLGALVVGNFSMPVGFVLLIEHLILPIALITVLSIPERLVMFLTFQLLQPIPLLVLIRHLEVVRLVIPKVLLLLMALLRLRAHPVRIPGRILALIQEQIRVQIQERILVLIPVLILGQIPVQVRAQIPVQAQAMVPLVAPRRRPALVMPCNAVLHLRSGKTAVLLNPFMPRAMLKS